MLEVLAEQSIWSEVLDLAGLVGEHGAVSSCVGELCVVAARCRWAGWFTTTGEGGSAGLVGDSWG